MDEKFKGLVEQARRLGGHKTQKAAIRAALREYTERHQSLPSLQAYGRSGYGLDVDSVAELQRKIAAQASMRKLRGKK